MKNNTLNYISIFDVALFLATIGSSAFVLYIMWSSIAQL